MKRSAIGEAAAFEARIRVRSAAGHRRRRSGAWRRCLWLVAAAPFALTAQAEPDVSRQLAVLQLFAGDWDVTVTMTRPKPLEVRYTESAVLTPGGRLLRSSTSVKPDGSQDWSMMMFDQASGGYPIWIFSSTGANYYLAPGKWNEGSRSIDWEAGPGSPVSHQTHCSFSDERTKSCQTVVKNVWGVKLLEQTYTAIRRSR